MKKETKFIDKQGKLFSKISIIDLAIILLVIALIIGIFGRLNNKSNILSNDDVFYVQFEISPVRQYSVDAVNVGDEIYEQHANIIGTVTSVDTEEPYDQLLKNDGTMTYAPINDRYTLLITLEVNGNITDTGYFANGNRQLSIGGDVALQSPYIISTGKIVDIYE